jgi:O-antigen/teichoic acid export membrane protein
MSLNRNILASYTSQIFVVGVGITVTPLYLKSMGAEAYGLVGFFTVMQSWFALLDLGLTPTISRETARFHGGGLSALAYRQLFRALSVIFCVIATLGGASIWIAAEAITDRWLSFQLLDHAEVARAVTLIGVCVALRWMGGLYRGVVSGAEHLVWLSGFNSAVAAVRFIGVFATMAAFGNTPFVFFMHQLAVNAAEVAVLAWRCRTLLPRLPALSAPIGWSVAPVKPMLQFAMGIALTSALWIAVTQSDRLFLSGILGLKEYGYFSVAVLVAGGITMITSPISMAITPRLARLHVEKQPEAFISVYKGATRLVTAIAGTLAVTLVVCAESALNAWTGNAELATSAAPIMQLYAAGNALLALAAFPFYIQYARGQLYFHIVGNVLLAILLLPAVVYAATNYGAVGAGWVWVAVNALYLSIWVAYVHHKLVRGLHLSWLRDDIARIIVPLILVGGLIAWFRPHPDSRVGHLLFCTLCACALGLTGIVAYRWSRLAPLTPLAQAA